MTKFICTLLVAWATFGMGNVSKAAIFTVINANATGAGSFYAAISQANAAPGKDTIYFSINTGLQTVTPFIAFPSITDDLLIDGRTQPGFAGMPLIELDGQYANGYGLVINGAVCTIYDLIVNRFAIAGIQVTGSAASGSAVYHCLLGTDATGLIDKGNTTAGIQLLNTEGIHVGDTFPGTTNLISGNNFYGIQCQNSDSCLIAGNLIGGDGNGQTILQNTWTSVLISGKHNQIGGTNSYGRNYIAVANSYGLQITADSNVVLGNYIGLTVDGMSSLRNQTNGTAVSVRGAYNTIGGSLSAARNVIAGHNTGANGGHGVEFFGTNAHHNVALGNYVGTNASGISALGHSHGVNVQGGAYENVIGSTISGAQNVLSGNYIGVFISQVTTNNNHVIGNYIGPDATGNTALGNSQGIHITYAYENTIGDGTLAGRNVISGNGTGIYLYRGSTQRNHILGNYIGLAPSGLSAMGNTSSGIFLFNARNNIIGDTTGLMGNYICSNGTYGIHMQSLGAAERVDSNLVMGNHIGTIPGGGNYGNNSYGIYLTGTSGSVSGNRIGNLSGTGANVIANNGAHGIRIHGSQALNNPIYRNSIFQTISQLGINLSSGGNNMQEAPFLISYLSGGGNLSITGQLISANNTTYRLEFFSSGGTDEGKTYLGSWTTTTDGSGIANFTATLTGVTVNGSEPVLSATATDPNENTSPFSSDLLLFEDSGSQDPIALPDPVFPEWKLLSRPARLEVYAPEDQLVMAEIYSMDGKRIAALFDGKMRGGTHQNWPLPRVARGIYVLHLQMGEMRVLKKVVLDE